MTAADARGEYITTGEAASLLGVSPKTVARWANEGKLPHITTLGGHRRFPKHELLRLTSGSETLPDHNDT